MEKQTAFERMFIRIAEITEIINLAMADGKTKPEIIKLIRERFDDFQDIGDSSFNAYIPVIPFVFNELNNIKQTNLAIQAELNSAKQENEVIKQQLNTTKQANQSILKELDSIKQQLNTSLNNLDSAVQDRDKAISELNSIKQQLNIKEKENMNGLNNELNSALNNPVDMEKIAIFMQETENRFVELNNRIKQLESNEQAVKQIKQDIKQRGLNNVGKWNIVESGGYYRAFRSIDGKNVGVYIGREFTEEKAREKITAKGFPID